MSAARRFFLFARSFVGARHCLALVPQATLLRQGNAVRRPYRIEPLFVGARHGLALFPQAALLHQGDAMRRPYKRIRNPPYSAAVRAGSAS